LTACTLTVVNGGGYLGLGSVKNVSCLLQDSKLSTGSAHRTKPSIACANSPSRIGPSIRKEMVSREQYIIFVLTFLAQGSQYQPGRGAQRVLLVPRQGRRAGACISLLVKVLYLIQYRSEFSIIAKNSRAGCSRDRTQGQECRKYEIGQMLYVSLCKCQHVEHRYCQISSVYAFPY
jgi:hypothetical protein